MKTIIIDGYIDEPSCLGVPPYISPYPRYIYGLLRYICYECKYYTIDMLRNLNFNIEADYEFAVIIGGLSVPGKYLNTTIITLTEINLLLEKFRRSRIVIAGPLKYGWTIMGGVKPKQINKEKIDFIADGGNYLEKLFNYFYQYSRKDNLVFNKEKIISLGAEIIQYHHYYPNVICEIETYSGCLRKERCSFCAEQFQTLITERNSYDIIAEIKELNKAGCNYFRIGNQPDIFGYGAKRGENIYVPAPEKIEELFYGIRTAVTDIKTLHTDNANPAIIAEYPIESKQILQTLIKYCTSGNVLALGAETLDDTLIIPNRLNTSSIQTRKAIEIINEYGSERGENGLPKLLPGINLLHGLIGETEKTWDINYNFLLELLNNNYMLRRINIRQIIKLQDSYIDKINPKISSKLSYTFKKYKQRIRENIDKEMLKKIAPQGIILKDLLTEKKDLYISFCRQIGAYPLLLGTTERAELFEFNDFVVCGHGYRSVTGLKLPIEINSLSYECLKTIDNIDKHIINEIIYRRPFKYFKELLECIPDYKKEVFMKLQRHIILT